MSKQRKPKNPRKVKKANTVKGTFLLLNLKIISENREGADVYRDIFSKLYNRKVIKNIDSEKAAILRTQLEIKLENGRYLYGKISKFTHIERGNAWLNLASMEPTEHELPAGLFPNLKETSYCFIPEAHRIAIQQSEEFSLTNAFEFFKRAVSEVLMPNEDFELTVEQSTDIFEAIFNAKQIKRLEIDISYTNSDINKEAVKWMDEELKDGQIQKLKLIATPDSSKNIKVDNTLMKGALGLAQSNGEVKATIVNEQNKSQRINTKEHPRKLQVESDSRDSLFMVVFDSVMSMFR